MATGRKHVLLLSVALAASARASVARADPPATLPTTRPAVPSTVLAVRAAQKRLADVAAADLARFHETDEYRGLRARADYDAARLPEYRRSTNTEGKAHLNHTLILESEGLRRAEADALAADPAYVQAKADLWAAIERDCAAVEAKDREVFDEGKYVEQAEQR